MDYTINLKTNNSEQFDVFLKFLKSFGIAEIIKIEKNSSEEDELIQSNDEVFLKQSSNNNNPSKYYGLWSNKNIEDIKTFRENLWQRK